MAYQIIYHKVLFIQYIILDFITNKTLEKINLATEDGQLRYIDVFGYKKFKSIIRRFNIDLLVVKQCNGFILRESLILNLLQNLNERSRRLVVAFYVLVLNNKEKLFVSKLFNIDPKTIRKGIKELLSGSILRKNKIRRSGGGRKSKNIEYEGFSEILEGLTEDHLAGDPMNSRRWVRKSLTFFKEQLSLLKIKASIPTIKKYFRKLNISLKVNKKSISNQQHKDRDLQFQQINKFKKSFLKSGNPVISVDLKKKEQLGQFKNPGTTWRKDPIEVHDHDFKHLSVGSAVPFGIYDLNLNKGYVYVGNSRETAQYNVEMIVKWWEEIGQFQYKNKKNLLILADAGGQNGYRIHGWKIELQNLLSSRFGLRVTICHYPSGASKYNPIERKLFSFISINWSGMPLNSYKTMLNFINSTTTKTGLTVKGYFIDKDYEKKKKYSERDKRLVNIRHMKVLPDWNYTLYP